MIKLLYKEEICKSVFFVTTRYFVRIKNFVSYIDITLHPGEIAMDDETVINANLNQFYSNYSTYERSVQSFDNVIKIWHQPELNRMLNTVDIPHLGQID